MLHISINHWRNMVPKSVVKGSTPIHNTDLTKFRFDECAECECNCLCLVERTRLLICCALIWPITGGYRLLDPQSGRIVLGRESGRLAALYRRWTHPLGPLSSRSWIIGKTTTRRMVATGTWRKCAAAVVRQL